MRPVPESEDALGLLRKLTGDPPTFTRGGRDEASRDGAPRVQFIDGEDLCDLLKEYKLGVSTRIRSVEDIEIDKSWFEQFEPA